MHVFSFTIHAIKRNKNENIQIFMCSCFRVEVNKTVENCANIVPTMIPERRINNN